MASGVCVMCKQDVDDTLQLGEKITFEDVTAHHFCLLLSGYLPQNGSDDEGILGFMPCDIKKETLRSKRQRCTFCRRPGANITCCHKKCRKSFHLPCAIQQQSVHFEFTGRFSSYCQAHHKIPKPNNFHQPTDLCAICYDQMGEYNVIQSIQPVCCKKANSWFHKICLQKYASNAGYFLKCPLCNDSKSFRKNIAKRGVFVPDRDANWEETGENRFYDFDQHDIFPTVCIAQNCQSHHGRSKYIDDDGEYLLVVCDSCGSKGVHESCLRGKEVFLCDDCDLQPPAKRRKLNECDVSSICRSVDKNNNTQINLNDAGLQKTNQNTMSTVTSVDTIVTRKCRIILPNLTEKDIRRINQTIQKSQKKRKSNRNQ